MDILIGLSAVVGGAVIAAGAMYILVGIGLLLGKMRRVANDYAGVCDHNAYWEEDRDFFKKIDKDRKEMKERMYRTERNADNAGVRLIEHVAAFKHTKKTKKRVKK